MKRIEKEQAIAASIIGTLVGVLVLFSKNTETRKKATIRLPDGKIVEGTPTNWQEIENSDMVRVTIGGKTYLTHSCNVVLVTEG